MDIKILKLSTNFVQWQLINLDETYSRNDRKVQLEIFERQPAQQYRDEYCAKILELIDYYHSLTPTLKVEEFDEIYNNILQQNNLRNEWIIKEKKYYEFLIEEDLKQQLITNQVPWRDGGGYALHEQMATLDQKIPQDNKGLESLENGTELNKKYGNSKGPVFTYYFMKPLTKGRMYRIRATIFYSYCSIKNCDLDVEKLGGESGYKTKMKTLFTNFPNFNIGEYCYNYDEDGKIIGTKILEPPSDELIADYILNLQMYKAEYDAAKNKDEAFLKLRRQVAELGYFSRPEFTGKPQQTVYSHDFYLHYPFISAENVINNKYNNWDFKYTNFRAKSGLQKSVEVEKICQSDQLEPQYTSKGEIIPQFIINITAPPTTKYDDSWLLPSTNITVQTDAINQYKTLHPPILEAYQSAFVGDEEKEYEIFFSLSNYTNINDVSHVDLKITLQNNGASVVDSRMWVDNIIYKIKSKNDIIDHGNGLYSVKIYSNQLQQSDLSDLQKGHWQNNTYYKVQARLGTQWSGWKDTKEYYTWKDVQVKSGNFSDWSTVMILKSIPKPTVSILNNIPKSGIITSEDIRVELSSSPHIYANYNQNNLNGDEFLDKYYFQLFDEENGELLETSKVFNFNYAEHSSLDSVTVSHQFKYGLKKDHKYRVNFFIETVNGYKDKAEYTFISYPKTLDIDEDFTYYNYKLTAKSDEENGIIKLFLETNSYDISKLTNLIGNFVISRRRTDEQVWEELKILQLFNETNLDNNEKIQINDNQKEASILMFIDFTPESGVQYEYGLQKINILNQRSERIFSNYITVNFEHIFLYNNNQQLKLKYNPEISSFKYNILTAKQDTLGSKYPHISRNGNVYYAEFPFSAIITFNSDEDSYFLKNLHESQSLINEYSRQGKEIISKQTVYGNTSFNTNLTYDNIYKEKIFRNEVERFLNNGENKLFRSATEGNLIVSLLDISFTPNQQLGRMIYEVSGTMCEIAEYNIDNLKKYNIFNMGKYSQVLGSKPIFGQISGYYTEQNNLFNTISNEVFNNYKSNSTDLTLFKINNLYLENYPKVKLNKYIQFAEVLENTSLWKEEQNYQIGQIVKYRNKFYRAIQFCRGQKPELNSEYWSLIEAKNYKNSKDLEQLQRVLDTYKTYTPINFSLNNYQITALPDTPYILKDQNFNSSNELYMCKGRDKTNYEEEDYYTPILLTYEGEANIQESGKNIIDNSYIRFGFDQLAGYFNKTNSNPYFAPYDENTDQIKTLKTGITYYNNLDIIEVIKEKIRLDLKEQYNDLKETITYVYDDKSNVVIKIGNKIYGLLSEIKNVVIETQNNFYVEHKDSTENIDQKFLTGPAGCFIESIPINKETSLYLKQPEDINDFVEYTAYGIVTYDYVLTFVEYLQDQEDEQYYE